MAAMIAPSKYVFAPFHFLIYDSSTPQVWAREDGRCTATLVGHRGAVTCLALGEDMIISGSDDGDVRLWNFSG